METSRLSTPSPSIFSRRHQLQATIGYYLAFVVLGMVVAVLGPTLPSLASQTGTTLADVSFLFTARYVGAFLGALLAGHVYDRYAGHPIQVVTLVFASAALFAVPALSWLWLLVLVHVVLGIAEGTLDSGTNTLLVWAHGKKVGPFMNGLHFFFGVGAFLTPVLTSQVLRRSESITWIYWILALSVLPVIVWLVFLPSPRQPARDENDGTGRADGVLIVIIAILLLFCVAAEVGFGGWIFSYTVATGLAVEADAANVNAAFWGAFTVGRLLSIPVADYLRPRVILLLDLLGAIASIALILLGHRSLVAVTIGSIGMGLAVASIFPTVLLLAERRMTITGRVTSWFFIGATLGAMSVPWLMGQIFSRVGPQATMVALALDLLLALALLGFLLWYSARRGLS